MTNFTKFLNHLVVVAVLLVCCQTTAQNLLSDPGFESGGLAFWQKRWTPYESGALCTTTAAYGSGSGLWIYTAQNSTSLAFSEIYQDIKAQPKDTFRATVYIRTPAQWSWAPASYTCVRISFLNSDKQIVAYYDSAHLTTPNTPYQVYAVSPAPAPDYTAYVRFSCYLYEPAGDTQQSVANFDECKLERAVQYEEMDMQRKWIAYAPTHYDPTIGQYPSEEEIVADLQVLRKAGFDSIITYGSERILGQIPHLARDQGFVYVVMGIWNPESEEELANAVKESLYVWAYCVGNEGLHKRYSLETLMQSMKKLKTTTGKTVVTTEEVDDYFVYPDLLNLGDFCFPNVHPYWHNQKEPKQAVQWTVLQYERLKQLLGNHPLLFKEVGLPTGGDTECSEDRQAEYYAGLKATQVPFSYFEAFDGPWKTWHAVEPHWGLFYNDRRPKKVLPFEK